MAAVHEHELFDTIMVELCHVYWLKLLKIYRQPVTSCNIQS